MAHLDRTPMIPRRTVDLSDLTGRLFARARGHHENAVLHYMRWMADGMPDDSAEWRLARADEMHLDECQQIISIVCNTTLELGCPVVKASDRHARRKQRQERIANDRWLKGVANA